MKTKEFRRPVGCLINVSSDENGGICVKVDSELCLCFTKDALKHVTWNRAEDPDGKSRRKGIFAVFHTRKQHDRVGFFVQAKTEYEITYFVGSLQMLGVDVKELKFIFSDSKSYKCMCCNKLVDHISSYESPSPNAKHYAEWRGIKNIEICDSCRNSWNKKMISGKKSQDARITAANKWLFDRICKKIESERHKS